MSAQLHQQINHLGLPARYGAHRPYGNSGRTFRHDETSSERERRNASMALGAACDAKITVQIRSLADFIITMRAARFKAVKRDVQTVLTLGVWLSALWVPDEDFGVSLALCAAVKRDALPAPDRDHFGDEADAGHGDMRPMLPEDGWGAISACEKTGGSDHSGDGSAGDRADPYMTTTTQQMPACAENATLASGMPEAEVSPDGPEMSSTAVPCLQPEDGQGLSLSGSLQFEGVAALEIRGDAGRECFSEPGIFPTLRPLAALSDYAQTLPCGSPDFVPTSQNDAALELRGDAGRECPKGHEIFSSQRPLDAQICLPYVAFS